MHITTGGTDTAEYDRLLARQDAMLLRRTLLAPDRASDRGPRPMGALADLTVEQALIRASLPLVGPVDALIDGLYANLFRRGPYLRALFPESMDFQRHRLGAVFGRLVDGLSRPERLVADCRELGREHRKLGVRPVHYGQFDAALRQTLRQRAGGAWTERLDAAWAAMLDLAVTAMTEGAQAAVGEPPYWTATVVGHEPRANGVAVLWAQPHEPYPYRAGQYARIESPWLPHAWRSYPVACAPNDDNILEFHIGQGPRGGVEDALIRRTRTGDRLRLGAAHAGLTWDQDWSGDVLIAAMGDGWPVARSLLEELTRSPGAGRVRLYLGVPSRDAFHDWAGLSYLTSRLRRFEVICVLADAPWPGEDGTVADALRRYRDFTGATACLAGPEPAMSSVSERLQELGLPPERIRCAVRPGASAERGPALLGQTP